MKHPFLIIVILMIACTAQAQYDWTNFGKYAQANDSIQRKGKNGKRIVLMGDSITEGWAKTDPDFFKQNCMIGRGISGQTTSQMLVRFRKDVLELDPDAVVILAGTNDIAQNNGVISLDNVLGNIKSMCEIAKANGIEVILCSVLPANRFSWRKELAPAEDELQLNRMIQVYAFEQKIPYVDYYGAMVDEQKGLRKNYGEDGVHPNAAGYEVMGRLLKKIL